MKHEISKKKHGKVLFHLMVLAAAGYGIYKMWGNLKEKSGCECPLRKCFKKLHSQTDKA